MKFKQVLLYSGGIDSYVAWSYLNKPQTIYFDLKSKYTQQEISLIKKAIPSTIIDNNLSFLGQMEMEQDAHIPFRNLYFALCAATLYSNTVYIAGLKDDNMTDKNEAVFRVWSEHFSALEGREIKIDSPFWGMTKAEVVAWYVKNYDYKDLLDYTFSCYAPINNSECNACQACFRKSVALFQSGVKRDFENPEILDYYEGRIGKGIYDSQRDIFMEKYIQWVRELL